ncbi:MAG: InlB B-repeat-containing protein [Clostridia bacterium]|nr:InlB B-repeat-containing protein [Clostridia bacterium]
MKKKALIAGTMLACAVSCALGLAACDFDGNNGDDNKKYVVYHLNGGYYGSDSDDTEEHRSTLYDNEIFIPSKAKKDTWLLENWYFDEDLTEVYSEARFAQLRAQKDEIDLYAKWIDEITVTKENFTEYFSVSSRWNGGGTVGSGGNASIYYSISPKMTFDVANSAESFEVEVTPILSGANNEIVWSGTTETVTLTSEANYSCSYAKKIDASADGVKFNTLGRTLEYELLTESFQMKLMHKVPVQITLDLGDGATDTYTATGSEKLLKSDLPTPEKKGYEFRGWYTDAEFKTEYTDWVVNRPRTLYAKFERKITVTYHMNGAAEKEAETYFTSQNIYPGSDPVREGYKFCGYYTTENFEEGTRFYSGAKSDVDLDLYARWAKIHTITFETNGAAAKEPLKVANNELPPNLGETPYKNMSVKFHGWYTDEACTHKFDEKAPVTEDVTLYALWVKEVNLSMLNLEGLKEYLDIELVDTKTDDGILTLTLTVSIKEEYRGYELYFIGDWRVDLYAAGNRLLSSGQTFVSADGMGLSTEDNKITVTGVYTTPNGYDDTAAIDFRLRFSGSGYLYIPEKDLETE